MKITRRQLKKIIRESLLTEAEMLKIMHNPYEDLDTMNAIANYALTNDIQGALADPLIDIDNVYYDIDEMKGWVHKVGKDDEGYFSEDVVVPENWDLEAVYQFMDDLEDAAFKARQKRDRVHFTPLCTMRRRCPRKPRAPCPCSPGAAPTCRRLRR